MSDMTWLRGAQVARSIWTDMFLRIRKYYTNKYVNHQKWNESSKFLWMSFSVSVWFHGELVVFKLVTGTYITSSNQ